MLKRERPAADPNDDDKTSVSSNAREKRARTQRQRLGHPTPTPALPTDPTAFGAHGERASTGKEIRVQRMRPVALRKSPESPTGQEDLYAQIERQVQADHDEFNLNTANRTGLAGHLAALPLVAAYCEGGEAVPDDLSGALRHNLFEMAEPGTFHHDSQLLRESGSYTSVREDGERVVREWPACSRGERCVAITVLPDTKLIKNRPRRPFCAYMPPSKLKQFLASGSITDGAAPCLLCMSHHLTSAHTALCVFQPMYSGNETGEEVLHLEKGCMFQPYSSRMGGADGYAPHALLVPSDRTMHLLPEPALRFNLGLFRQRLDHDVREPRLRVDLSAARACDDAGTPVHSREAARSVAANLCHLEQYFREGGATHRGARDTVYRLSDAEFRAVMEMYSPFRVVPPFAPLDSMSRLQAVLCNCATPPHVRLSVRVLLDCAALDLEPECHPYLAARRFALKPERCSWAKEQVSDGTLSACVMLSKALPRAAVTRHIHSMFSSMLAKAGARSAGVELFGHAFACTMLGTYPHVESFGDAQGRTAVLQAVSRLSATQIASTVSALSTPLKLYALRELLMHRCDEVPPFTAVLRQMWGGGSDYDRYRGTVQAACLKARLRLYEVARPGDSLAQILRAAAPALAAVDKASQREWRGYYRDHSRAKTPLAAYRPPEKLHPPRVDCPARRHSQMLYAAVRPLVHDPQGPRPEREILMRLLPTLSRECGLPEADARLMHLKGAVAPRALSEEGRRVMQMLGAAVHHHKAVRVAWLPRHYLESQLHTLGPEVDMRRAELVFCPACFSVQTTLDPETTHGDDARRCLSGGECYGLHGASMDWRGRTTCHLRTALPVDAQSTSPHTTGKRATHKQSRVTMDGRYCSTSVSRRLSLLGRVAIIHGRTYLLCPQPGCARPMHYQRDECDWTEHGVCCNRCTVRNRVRHAPMPLLRELRRRAAVAETTPCDACRSPIRGIPALLAKIDAGVVPSSHLENVFVYPHHTLLCGRCNSDHAMAWLRNHPESLASREATLAALRDYTRACNARRRNAMAYRRSHRNKQ